MPDTNDHPAASTASTVPRPYRPEIRFVDIDAYGIVHNATYLVYLEQARIHWWRQVVREAWDWTQIGVLVAHHDIDYVAPVRLGMRWRLPAAWARSGTRASKSSTR